MSFAPHVAFLGTSRSGLGHLRRITNIAEHLARRAPGLRLSLVTNADPSALGPEDLRKFAQTVVCPRAEMSRYLVGAGVTLAVVDTMALPGMAVYRGCAVLILRETPQVRLTGFRRDDGRAWDCVIVPNTQDHWMPALDDGFTHRIEASGWILRKTGPRRAGEHGAGIVLATGGGGTPKTRARLYPMLGKLLRQTRAKAKQPFRLRQACGPRADGQIVPGVDAVFDPGPELNRVFWSADLVMSTAGYNSVLELASTDTPALIVPIPRSLDDQENRVRLWGERLGFGLGPGQLPAAVDWLADQIDHPRRRTPVDLGPDGAVRAADILEQMLCQVS